MDTIFCLDTSGSMAGTRIQELKTAVVKCIEVAAQLQLGEKFGVVSFGSSTGLQRPLTNNYQLVINTVKNLSAGGGTPMGKGLTAALQELTNGRILQIGSLQLRPRLILMTDGEPDDKNEVLAIAKIFGDHNIPIACVGVSGCNQQLMKQIAALSGGMFVYASEVDELVLFFLEQIILTFYIAEFAEKLEELFSREVLRQYMKDKTGHEMNDQELDLFVAYLKVLAKPTNNNNTKQKKIAPSSSYSGYGSTNNRYSPRIVPYESDEKKGTLCCAGFFYLISLILFILVMIFPWYTSSNGINFKIFDPNLPNANDPQTNTYMTAISWVFGSQAIFMFFMFLIFSCRCCCCGGGFKCTQVLLKLWIFTLVVNMLTSLGAVLAFFGITSALNGDSACNGGCQFAPGVGWIISCFVPFVNMITLILVSIVHKARS